MKKNTKPKKQSVKGGASSHLRPCKVAYCDKHNERLDRNPSNSNIRPEYSANNSVWKDPDVPNLVTLDRQIRNDYFKAHGRHMPNRGTSKASPIKESVTLMPNGSKDTDAIHYRITERMEKEFGIRCIRRFNHRDEYCDETGEFNWHGHEVWDMYDHENHRMVALTRDDCRKWQDIVAQETGMPRGNPAYETRRKWLTANEYKIKKQNESIAEKEAKIETLNNQIREKDVDLAKTANSPLARVNPDVKSKMSWNYSHEEVFKMMAKAKAEADERVRTVKAQADMAMTVAVNEANAKVKDVQNEMERIRQALAKEKQQKEKEIRIAADKASGAVRELINKTFKDAVDRSTAELRGKLDKTESALLEANSKIEKLQNGFNNASLLAHTFLTILKDDSVAGSMKNDVLALFSDHLDENGRKVVSEILAGNCINRRLRTTAELERYRKQKASQPKSKSQTKGQGRA